MREPIIDGNSLHCHGISTMRSNTLLPMLMVFAVLLLAPLFADDLKPGVRGLATRAPADMKIDGDLSEFESAFCTPVNYFFQAEKQPLIKDRAAQFFYMWTTPHFMPGCERSTRGSSTAPMTLTYGAATPSNGISIHAAAMIFAASIGARGRSICTGPATTRLR